jgi:hypothetical protein
MLSITKCHCYREAVEVISRCQVPFPNKETGVGKCKCDKATELQIANSCHSIYSTDYSSRSPDLFYFIYLMTLPIAKAIQRRMVELITDGWEACRNEQ